MKLTILRHEGAYEVWLQPHGEECSPARSMSSLILGLGPTREVAVADAGRELIEMLSVLGGRTTAPICEIVEESQPLVETEETPR